jgi:hypothetical protein
MSEIQLAFDAMEALDLELAKTKSMSHHEECIFSTELVSKISQGKGIYESLPYEARIALAFYAMGFSKSNKTSLK